jgi:hypothetical protein
MHDTAIPLLKLVENDGAEDGKTQRCGRCCGRASSRF